MTVIILQKKVQPCFICGRVVSRAFDLQRHMKVHYLNASELVLLLYNLLNMIVTDSDWCIFYRKLACDWEGCSFKALQQSNMDTHKRRQYVLFIFFPPPHWCISLLLALMRRRLFVQTTPVAIFGPVIRRHYSVTGKVFMDISRGLAASEPLQPLPWIPLPLPAFPLLHTFPLILWVL